MNFTNPDIALQLRVVNDGVMGGRSNSRFTATPDGVVFEGMVSLENNGGFASLRCPARFPDGASTLQLRARGDGKRYQLLIRTELSSGAPLYRSHFVASSQWQTHQFRPQDFEAAFRGRAVAASPLMFSEAREIGILIGDKQAGGFRLELQQVLALQDQS